MYCCNNNNSLATVSSVFFFWYFLFSAACFDVTRHKAAAKIAIVWRIRSSCLARWHVGFSGIFILNFFSALFTIWHNEPKTIVFFLSWRKKMRSPFAKCCLCRLRKPVTFALHCAISIYTASLALTMQRNVQRTKRAANSRYVRQRYTAAAMAKANIFSVL